MSEDNKKPNNNKKRRNNNKRRPNNRNAKSGTSNNSNNNQRRRRYNNRRRNNNRNLSPEEQFLRKYEYHRKNHDQARANYFAQFNRVDDNKRRKLELTFFRAVEELRKFEEQMTEEQWSIVHKHKFVKYKPELTYSENHDINEYETYNGELEDSMMLESQKKRDSFADDTEESSGSIEDYKKYKGL